MGVYINRKGSYASISAIANTTIALADLATTGETVNSFTIAEINFSGSVTLLRGANTVLKLNGTDHWSLAGKALTQDSTAPLTIQINDDNSSAIVTVHKTSSYVSSTGG